VAAIIDPMRLNFPVMAIDLAVAQAVGATA
jgi:hypothetical protein